MHPILYSTIFNNTPPSETCSIDTHQWYSYSFIIQHILWHKTQIQIRHYKHCKDCTAGVQVTRKSTWQCVTCLDIVGLQLHLNEARIVYCAHILSNTPHILQLPTHMCAAAPRDATYHHKQNRSSSLPYFPQNSCKVNENQVEGCVHLIGLPCCQCSWRSDSAVLFFPPP